MNNRLVSIETLPLSFSDFLCASSVKHYFALRIAPSFEVEFVKNIYVRKKKIPYCVVQKLKIHGEILHFLPSPPTLATSSDLCVFVRQLTGWSTPEDENNYDPLLQRAKFVLFL